MENLTIKEIQNNFIILNTNCNQKCIYCSREPTKHLNQTSELGVVKKKISKLSISSGFKKVIFTGGEPLLYPHLTTVIRFAKNLGLRTEIQTNGTLLGKYIIELKKSGLDQIYFAFPSHKEDTSNNLRGTNVGFEDTVKNLILANKMDFSLHIIHVINSLNYKELPNFVDFIYHLKLKRAHINFSLICPVGWAWKNKWIIPRMRDVKPYLIKAMEKCKKYDFQFDVSEIVPLCCVDGFEDHAISTSFKISKFEINDDYNTGKRRLNFSNPNENLLQLFQQKEFLVYDIDNCRYDDAGNCKLPKFLFRHFLMQKL